MENGNHGKILSAVSMESLDNCSTISSIDQPSQVRTLFVSGLPLNTRPRELYLLFRSCPGYKTSQLKVTNKKGKTSSPIGFVTFSTRSNADEARRQLHGICFDPENPQTLRLELAKQTTKATKPKQISPPIISPNLTNNGMLPPSILNTNNFISNAATHNTANAAAAAAAYAVAAQQAAAMAAVSNVQDHNVAASLMAMNGANFDQFSFLSALSESQQQQAMTAFPQLMPFAATNQAALFPLFTPISTTLGASAIQQVSGQQAAIAAAMAQLQHHQQAQNQHQQNAMAAIAAANPFLSLPPPPPPTSQSLGHCVQQQQQAAALMAAAVAAASNVGNGSQQQPCSTLFVANLGSNPIEEELRQLFKTFPGFSRLRMHTKGGSPVAFVEFNDVRQAVVALNGLQGYQISSVERGNGIRIEFARSKMGDVGHTNNSANGSINNNNNSSSLKVNS